MLDSLCLPFQILSSLFSTPLLFQEATPTPALLNHTPLPCDSQLSLAIRRHWREVGEERKVADSYALALSLQVAAWSRLHSSSKDQSFLWVVIVTPFPCP